MSTPEWTSVVLGRAVWFWVCWCSVQSCHKCDSSMLSRVVLRPELQLGIQCLQYLLHCQAAERFFLKRTSATSVKLVLCLLIFAAVK